MRVGIRRRAAHVARVGKEIRRAPEQLDAGRFLQRLRVRNDLVEVAIRFGQRAAFWGDITIVKRIEWRFDLLEKFKRRIHPRLRHGNGVLALFPRPHDRARAERIGADAAERMPVGDREPHLVFHRPAVDHFGGIIMFERERVGAARAFVGNRLEFGEMRFSHGAISVHLLPAFIQAHCRLVIRQTDALRFIIKKSA